MKMNEQPIQQRKHLVRIEYPGCVKNTNKALETLGGKESIEAAVSDPSCKLKLGFHPSNKFNQSCTADKDTNPGLLIKVNGNPNPESSADTSLHDAEVVGPVIAHFKFNRLMDYQYLPLLPQGEENENSEVNYIHDAIIPKEIPSLSWLVRKSTAEQMLFLTPPGFSRFELPQKLYLNTAEKYASANIRQDIYQNIEQQQKYGSKRPDSKSSCRSFTILVDFTRRDFTIPNEPHARTIKYMKKKSLESQYNKTKRFFDERPIWTRNALHYRSGLTNEHSKFLLPSIAYFCNNGPWRMCWIRYGYDPTKDYMSRIYQTLDYRIKEGTKLIVSAKRKSTKSFDNPLQLKSSKATNTKYGLEERTFVLKPNSIPPARQMFYQLCDVYIPEIQEMLTKLPKLPARVKCDPKNGWLPSSFIEQCREIADKYIMEAVRNQLPDTLSEIRQGGRDSVSSNIPGCSYQNPIDQMDERLSVIDLEDTLDASEVQTVIDQMPETIEDLDEEAYDDISDIEIDSEAVDDVNQIIHSVRENI